MPYKPPNRVDSFQGSYRFLSNFWLCRVPRGVPYNGINYPSVEHAYQAAKTRSKKERERVLWKDWRTGLKLRVTTPGEAKRAGQTVTLRKNWNRLRRPVMEKLLRRKFEDPQLAEMLLQTEDAVLIEGNNWGDTFWGVCNGVGENHQGKLLMKIRQELKVKRSGPACPECGSPTSTSVGCACG